MIKKIATSLLAIILSVAMLAGVPAEARANTQTADASSVAFYKHVYHKTKDTNAFMNEEKFLFNELKKYGLEKSEPYVFAYACWASGLNSGCKTGKGKWVGYFQFSKKYWKEMYKRAGLKKAKITDPYDQIRVFCSEYAMYMKKSKTYQEGLGRFYSGGKRSKSIEKKIMNMFKEKVKVW